jgi:3-deoxy-D-manno-octulosonate 8-phosphate phosphatase (KDO 8-P phosphatase)
MSLLEQFRQITCFVFDVDGVLTDGSLLVLDDGQQVRRMNIRDGYALQLAVKKGYRVVIISGGTSDGVAVRLQKLGVKDIFLSVENKRQQLAEYLEQHGISKREVLFMGDDIPDYAVMKESGLPCCPADAAPEIKELCIYISGVNGGYGCARDVIEKVLKLNNHWHTDTTIRAK